MDVGAARLRPRGAFLRPVAAGDGDASAAPRLRPEWRTVMSTSIRTTLACIAALAVLAGVEASVASSATVVFQFKRISNPKSQLTIAQYDTSTGKIYSHVTMRAGSGVSTNECATGQG